MDKRFIILLGLVCLIVFFNGLNTNFILDDKFLVVNNPFIKSAKFIPEIFRSGLYNNFSGMDKKYLVFDKMYRPLQSLSYFLDYRIWGMNPWGFHLTNLILHFFNALLIFYLLRHLFDLQVARAVSLLFAVQPVNISCVTYIAGRADLLAAFFMLLGMFLFARFLKTGARLNFLGSLISAAAALLCRESALSLFLFQFLILSAVALNRRRLIWIVPFVLLDLMYLFLRFQLFGNSAFAMHPMPLSLPLRVVNFFNIAWHYLLTLFLPLDLHMFRSTALISGIYNIKFLGATVFAAFYSTVLFRFRKDKLLFFGLLWFLLGLLPVFFAFDSFRLFNKVLMAESWLYLAQVGFLLIFAFFLKSLSRLGKPLFLALMIFYSFLTIVQSNIWKNSVVFYENILEYNPDSNLMRKNLILEYLQNGMLEDADKQISNLLLYGSADEDYFLLRGFYCFLNKDLKGAEENFQESLKIRPDYHQAVYGLSLCFKDAGKFDDAIRLSLQTLNLNPYYIPAMVNLGDLYRQKADLVSAQKYYDLAGELSFRKKKIRVR